MANVRYTNLPSRDLADTNQRLTQDEKTRVFFNGYFDQSVQITGSEWDIVYGFFRPTVETNEQANALSEAVIVSARNNDLNPIDVVRDLEQYDGLELDKLLALYLNQTRRDTSLLGYADVKTVNRYVSRNINA